MQIVLSGGPFGGVEVEVTEGQVEIVHETCSYKVVEGTGQAVFEAENQG